MALFICAFGGAKYAHASYGTNYGYSGLSFGITSLNQSGNYLDLNAGYSRGMYAYTPTSYYGGGSGMYQNSYGYPYGYNTNTSYLYQNPTVNYTNYPLGYTSNKYQQYTANTMYPYSYGMYQRDFGDRNVVYWSPSDPYFLPYTFGGQ